MVKDGQNNVRSMRDNAEEVIPPDQPPPHEEESEISLPAGCPVIPLGIYGDFYFYLDQRRQLREVKDKDHSRLKVSSLFGDQADLLEEFWPRMKQDGNDWVVTGWKPEVAAQALMSSAARKGVWSSFGRVRGAGAWPGQNGELILHLGSRLSIIPEKGRAKWEEPGEIDGFVYPSAPQTQRPADKSTPWGDGQAAAELLTLLKTWNFRRGEVDALLLLGWIGAGMLGGALPWRPVLWMTGGKHTGKSTLQMLMEYVFGQNGLLHTGDATEAGIRQTLGYSSMPVAIDEAESEEDNRKLNALVKLARNAASGALGVRGGSDHNAASFMLWSCVAFSSILVPPMLGQDRSRMAILELGKLGSTKPPIFSRAEMDKIGQVLRRRLVDGWHRWPQTLEAYRQGLADVGHVGRGCDVFGTLLACADLLMHDDVPDTDSIRELAAKLAAEDLAELEGDITDEAHCLSHLLTYSVELKGRGDRRTIGWWILEAAMMTDSTRSETNEAKEVASKTNRALQTFGIKLMDYMGERFLAVANSHQGLAHIFEKTHWGSRSGTLGVWVQAMRRLPGALVPGKTLWIGGEVKGTLIPLDLITPKKLGDSPTPTSPELDPSHSHEANETGQGPLPYRSSPDPMSL